MRSNLAALALAVLAGSGCGFKVFNDPPAKGPIEIDGVATGCLNGFSSKVAAYFEGRGKASEIRSLGACADNALKTFGEKTRGSEAGHYSAEELRRFLNRYFVATESALDQPFWAA